MPSDTVSSDLSWWQRPRRLKRQLAGSMIAVTVLSVGLVGGLNFIAGRRLLNEGTSAQMASVGEARARSIELGVDRTLSQISALAADLSIVEPLDELAGAFQLLEQEALDPAEQAELDQFYERTILEPLRDLGFDTVTGADLQPASRAGRYLQYHYTIGDGGGTEDDSNYGSLHDDADTRLRLVAEQLGLGDLLLVSREGTVVYSAENRIDLGTNLVEGPNRDSPLAHALTEQLPRVRIGESVIGDQQLYLPAGGQPVVFAAAAVRHDTEVIGALVVEIPSEAMSQITTSEGEWEAVGLGDGESYIVGPDLRLRSESRRWLEDPDGYLDQLDERELVPLVAALGSPVGLQSVDTEPVREALDGRVFEGSARNYLGERTQTYAAPIDAPGMNWVMVAEIPLSDARAPLFTYARRLGLVLAGLLPAAALIGVVLASRLTRPIRPVVEAADAVAAGEREPSLPDLGHDEFGDLARRLQEVATQLGQEEQALADEFERKRGLLLTVLPARLVEPHGEIVSGEEPVVTSTIVAVTIELEPGDGQSSDSDVTDLLGVAIQRADALADQWGVERIRVTADRYLFRVGPDGADQSSDDGTRTDRAIAFALELRSAIASLGEQQDASFSLQFGLAAGPVGSGILRRGHLTFAAWGEPVRRALSIATFATDNEIVVDDSARAEASGTRWSISRLPDAIALDGQPLSIYVVSDS
ncbi:MAG: HAMP domain-containing protein [Actinomycetia bacterium]|nr:HAMP domain-containing protein [Actinomycetes bacterium]